MDPNIKNDDYVHEHLMVRWNDLRKGDCCGRFEVISDGYYCQLCDFFAHKTCGDALEYIKHPSHSEHTFRLRNDPDHTCDFCGKRIVLLYYHCGICEISMDICCAKHPPADVIENSKIHRHKLTLLKKLIKFNCDAKCGEIGDGFPYKCHECDLTFHVDCVGRPSEVKYPPEVNHSYHPLHPLKLVVGRPPDYSDGKCRLCGRKIDDQFFYHCSFCNFSLDVYCVLNPPPQSLLDLRVHDHQLTLIPRPMSFTCTACGLKGDRSPYACVSCDFMIHKDCFGLPNLININRHEHRISRTSLLGVVNSVCAICHHEMDWTCGGFSCQRCPGYVVHSKCATRYDIWNEKDLEGEPEDEDTEPYKLIEENTIHHFSHEEHYLRLKTDGNVYEENKWCNACSYVVGIQSYYDCMDCDFLLHEKCAQLPIRKRSMLALDCLTLVTSKFSYFTCPACHGFSNTFRYGQVEYMYSAIDVRCASIVEPFNHPSHPHHPLYFISLKEEGVCNGCNKKASPVLKCIEDDCGFVLDFKCATLPQVVKHRVDNHPLSLCYGEEKASGKYWCDICEKETNPNTWFYTSKDQEASLHTKCVLGDLTGLKPRTVISFWDTPFEVVVNDSVSRPVCMQCKSHCMYPTILRKVRCSYTYFCSFECEKKFRLIKMGKLAN